MRKKRILSNPERSRRLMNRWAFDAANRLMADGCMTRRGALQQAYLLRQLLEALGAGSVQFMYEKQDGTLRTAWGTLCRGVDAGFDHYEYRRDDLYAAKLEGTTYCYWDMEAAAFRSFKAENLKRICQIVSKPKTQAL